MNKYFLIGLVLIVLSSFTFAADGCYQNENCTWYAYGVTNETGVNISFTYDNGTTSEEFPMDSLGLGKYLYTTKHNLTGNILGCARSYNSTSTIQTNCESKEIYFSRSYQEIEMLAEVYGIYVVFFIGILLALVGQYMKNPYVIAFSSIWFILGAVTTFLQQGSNISMDGSVMLLFFVLLSGLLGTHAWFFYERTRDNKLAARRSAD